MSYSTEILPTIKLPDDWHNKAIKIMNSYGRICSIGSVNETYFYLVVNNQRTFDFWLSEKEPSIFPDNTYIEGYKHSEKINTDVFLEKFANVPYSIYLESKPTRKENELELMIEMTSALAKITDGLILFDQDFFGYYGNELYLSEDVKLQ